MKSLMGVSLLHVVVSVIFRYKPLFGKICYALILCFAASIAEGKTAFDGRTPLALAPGSPAGSYSLTEFENINLFNGNLNVNLPLMQVGGRGSVGYTMTAVINDNRWIIEPFYGPYGFVMNVPKYGWWGALREDYGPGIMQGRGAADPCAEGTSQTLLLTRLTFTGADGTETEFIDTSTNGVAQLSACVDLSTPRFNRGKIFVSTDGSFTTFISDTDIWDSYKPHANFTPSGYLLYKDGTRLRIVNGLVESMRDSNGNQITFGREYISTPHGQRKRLTINDSLNRKIIITYDLTHSNPNTVYDKIEWAGTNGAARQILIFRTLMSNSLAPGYTIKQYGNLFPDTTGGLTYGNFDTYITSSVQLPDERQYRFLYNDYGEIARITLPTGGAIEYDYVCGSNDCRTGGLIDIGQDIDPDEGGFMAQAIWRRIGERRSYPEGGTGNGFASRVLYSGTWDLSQGDEMWVNVTHYGGNNSQLGIVTGYESHRFHGSPRTSLVNSRFPSEYPSWKDGREYETVWYKEDKTTEIKKQRRIWEQAPPFTGTQTERANNPRVAEIINTLSDANKVSKQEFDYDAFNNQTDVYEYEFGGTQSVRRTHTDFVTDPNYTSHTGAHLRSLPLRTWISSDSAGSNKVSFVEYEYDNYTPETENPKHAALVPRANVTGFDAAYNLSCTDNTVQLCKRGNATKVKTFTDAAAQTGAIETYTQYDVLGNIVKTIDGKGYVSTIDYTDRFDAPDDEARGNWLVITKPNQLNGLSTFAFPTSGTNALGWTIGYMQFDYYTGQPVNAEDFNGVISKTVYNDPLDRPTQTVSAIGTPLERQSNIIYDDANRRIETKGDLDALNDNKLKSESFYDGLGRTIETRRYEAGGGYVATKSIPFVMAQDPETQVWRAATKVSNPYRPLANEPLFWMTSLSDALGRTIKVITPDGAIAKTEYSGNAVTVTDQAGKQRRSITNALGQLTEVHEPNNAGQLGTVGSPTQPTLYSYDALNNLTRVEQNGASAEQCGATTTCAQTRSFTYDSLSRLKSANNPEAGLISYEYDASGNLTKKTDARLVVTNYVYDALNRVTNRNYSAPAGLPNYQTTPNVTYTYDNLPNAKGKLIGVDNGTSKTEYQAFDILGRVTQSKQFVDGASYGEPMTYTYNLSGALIEQKYPSGRVVKNVLNADGDLSIVQSKKNANAGFWNYAKNFTYTAAGAVSSMQLGNGRWESTVFNSRLQPTQIALGSTQNATDKLKLTFSYNTFDNTGAANPDNNGNVLSQTIQVPAETIGGQSQAGFTATQTYTYDSLNRIKYAKEIIGASQQWKQTFLYDRYGNRNFDEGGTSGNYLTTTLQRNCPESSYNPNGICNKKAVNPTIASNNKIVQDQDSDGQDDYRFDPSGNTTKNADGQSFIYDGENKQVEVKNSLGQTIGLYWYDGDGKRVKKYVPSTGETTVFVYDASGKLVAEYSTVVEPAVTAKMSYLTNDHLGSPRINTDANGATIARHDYQPFGEEIIRTAYGADAIRQKFTSYERDNETELDFAQARMYSKNHGRFTTTDPTLLSVNGFNPQSWNRYVYVLNNPLLYTDPLGLWEVRYDEVYKDKKNKDGTVTKVFSHYVAKAYKTKGDKDTPAELARQLGLKGKEADKFVENFNKKGFSDGVEMTKLGGDVGRIFGVVQDKLSDQRKEDEKGKGNNPSDGTYADCSSTSANLYSPLSGANGENWSVYVMDEYIKNNLTSKSEEDLRVGDVVRYANDKNVPKHFTTFIFRNDDGVPQVFSRSGEGGRFERGSASNFTSANPRYSSYGTIRGIGKNSTGYYGRR